MRSVLYFLSVMALLFMIVRVRGYGQHGTSSNAKQGPTVQPFRLFNPDTMAKPTAGYSQVAEVAGGKMIYVAGQVAMDASGTLVGKDDFRAQVEQVFKNINAAVQAAGGDFHSVIKLNYFCAESVDAALIPSV